MAAPRKCKNKTLFCFVFRSACTNFAVHIIYSVMAGYYGNIREEELKNRVAADWFADFDTTRILGNVDFSVAVRRDKVQGDLFANETEYLLWAEAKKGTSHDMQESFVQLILTIGKARTYDYNLPPKFLGAFDAEEIAFLPYNAVMEVFAMNDFNWNVTPSDHQTREFRLVLNMVRRTLNQGAYVYNYETDGRELAKFIRQNFRPGDMVSTIRINKNNFTHIYRKWLAEVMPTIDINWAEAKKEGLLDADFYLADILSRDNKSIKEKLYVLLETDRYRYNIHRKATGALSFDTVEFRDGQRAHTQFWLRYSRPPREEYWDYIVERRDLLVPQDIRERKGSFFTPSRWVELSQDYMARELGEDWQDEYYVWDCCAGTGNLLAGLTNKWHVFASTLDPQDVRAMQDLISTNRLNLLASHVFQFDFLNDHFDRLPDELRKIIDDPEERRKLVIYINPPYAEAASKHTVSGLGKNKTDVAVQHLTYKKYLPQIGIAGRELFAQFFIRIYDQLAPCILAEFSTLKILQAPNFHEFRNVFRAKLGQIFIVPANTFDNVKGQFPIGFFIWHTEEKETFSETTADVYDEHGKYIGEKTIATDSSFNSINDWIITTRRRENEVKIGFMAAFGCDFQHRNYNYIINGKEQLPHPRGTWVTDKNIKEIALYFAVRQCIEATWLNDRDQFLYPKDSWKEDKEFQSDCLAFTLFNNNIQSQYGTNHWIPFTEEEVDAKERFASHFMSDYIRGKRSGAATKRNGQADLFAPAAQPTESEGEERPITFSPEAQAVMDAGRELWRYYHSQPGANPNASFYDIRLHFQGTNDKGKMNPDSKDARYKEMIIKLRARLRTLARKLAPRVYAHGFLLN